MVVYFTATYRSANQAAGVHAAQAYCDSCHLSLECKAQYLYNKHLLHFMTGCSLAVSEFDRTQRFRKLLLRYCTHTFCVCVLEHQVLITNGAKADARDSTGVTPLMLAAGLGGVEVVKYLIQCGADPWLIDIKGQLPLHGAAEVLNESCYSSILNHRLARMPGVCEFMGQ